ncbi:MAG: hypothetical protein VX574_03100 [Myxococcota bacterium]|nr:hypothetical protein [Myxococcota bacterium]
MNTQNHRDSTAGLFALGVVGILLAAGLVAGRSLEWPGLYYDEAVQARPALEWATGETRASALPGSHAVWVGGRPFPLMTQPYMGGLKSQVLAGPFWLFGPDVRVLRGVTLGIALLGIGGLAFFARRAFGKPTGWLVTLLLASDPSILLLARHDWGSFSISLLLRSVVLLAGWLYWETRRTSLLWIAAFALGLGFYNKIDFAIFATGAGVALGLCAGREVAGLIRQNALAWAGACVAFFAGLGPLLLYLPTIFERPSAFGFQGEGFEKAQTLWTLLDGSHFHRLMEHGGLFQRIGEVEGAPAGPLVILFAFAIAFVVFRWATAPSQSDPRVRCGRFLLFANLVSIMAFLALPGAVRIHHALNIVPFPHLLVAFVLVDLATLGTDRVRRFVPRFAITALVVGVVTLQVAVYEETRHAFAETGGRGRWSSATSELARELRGTPTQVMSLDWGLHEPLALLGAGTSLDEVHWRIPGALRRTGSWRMRGNEDHLYVLHQPPFDLFGYGEPFLEAVRAQAPDSYEIRSYADGRGQSALVTVRFRTPHEIVYDGRFSVRASR